MKYLGYIVIILSMFFQQQSIAQKFVASATLDTTEILIGDQVRFTWQINSPKDYRIVLPQFADTLVNKVEIIKKEKLDTLSDNQNQTLKQSFIISSFDSGYYKIPAYTFLAIDKSNDTLEINTNEVFLYVNTVPVDTTQAIKDIKTPIDQPLTIDEVLPYIYWGLGTVAAILTVIYILRRFKKKKPIISKPKPLIPPHVTAIQALDTLKQKKLWQNNQEKLYHSELTEIIRIYIEDRFQVAALEMTSDEIIENLKGVIKGSGVEILSQIFTTADLVKFAKAKPLPTEHDLSLTNAYVFINETKIEPKAPIETIDESKDKDMNSGK